MIISAYFFNLEFRISLIYCLILFLQFIIYHYVIFLYRILDSRLRMRCTQVSFARFNIVFKFKCYFFIYIFLHTYLVCLYLILLQFKTIKFLTFRMDRVDKFNLLVYVCVILINDLFIYFIVRVAQDFYIFRIQ